MILDIIANASRKRIEEAKKQLPLSELKRLVYEGQIKSVHGRETFAFEKALMGKITGADKTDSTDKAIKGFDEKQKKDIAFICEVKKASPSKGLIAEGFPYLEIAKEYEEAGADCISVLTEPDYFQGDNRYLTEISREVNIPVLRKDFTVDEYQIYEAKLIGADAVLLICSLLDTNTLHKYIKICHDLGLSALVEAHTSQEIQSAISAGARIIGVNNRNLKTFEVDLSNSIRLRELVPRDIIFVAESGISTSGHISQLRAAGVNAVLIGETLMRSKNKRQMLEELRG